MSKSAPLEMRADCPVRYRLAMGIVNVPWKPKRTPKQRPVVIAKLRKLAFRFIRATK